MQYATGQVTVSVPATSANLGPGFDSMGLALDLRDELVIEALASDEVDITVVGEGQDCLPRDGRHLVVRALWAAQELLGLPQTGLRLQAHNRIPQARGMGSSASAIVAGVAAAVAFSGRTDLGKDFIFDVAAQMEGHPDNVAPAVYGGLTVSWKFDPDTDLPASVLDREAASETGSEAGLASAGPVPSRPAARSLPSAFARFSVGFHAVSYPVDGSLHVYVLIPTATLSTKAARTILPDRVPYQAALSNLARTALLPAAMGAVPAADSNALLFCATADRLHQDYRRELYPDSWQLMTHLRSRGYAAAISGAGPCVLVLHSGDAEEAVRAEVSREWLSTGHWSLQALPIDSKGVIIS